MWPITESSLVWMDVWWQVTWYQRTCRSHQWSTCKATVTDYYTLSHNVKHSNICLLARPQNMWVCTYVMFVTTAGTTAKNFNLFKWVLKVTNNSVCNLVAYLFVQRRDKTPVQIKNITSSWFPSLTNLSQPEHLNSWGQISDREFIMWPIPLNCRVIYGAQETWSHSHPFLHWVRHCKDSPF